MSAGATSDRQPDRSEDSGGFGIDPVHQARVYAGETYRSQKPSTYRFGKSPGSYGTKSGSGLKSR